MLIATHNADEDLLAKVARLEAELAKSYKVIDQLRAKQAELQVELDLLRRRIYVARAERVDTRQLEMEFATKLKHLDDLSRDQGVDPAIFHGGDNGGKSKKRTGKALGRRNLSDMNLPEIRVNVTDPMLEEMVKEGRATQMNSALSYKLAWVRGGFRKLVIARSTYRLVNSEGDSTLVTAEMPPQSTERSLAAPSLIAHIAKAKYDMGMPLARLERDFRHSNAPIDRGTMCRWMEEVGGLVGSTVVEAMIKDAKANAFCLSTDATRIAIQPIPEPGKRQPCRNGNFFVIIADRDHVFFEYTPRETSDAVAKMFAGFTGYIQADAKSVYDILFRAPPGKDKADIALPKEVGCFAHCRRNFWEAAITLKDPLMREGLIRIHRLYKLEDTWRDKPPEEIYQLRNKHLRPELVDFFQWAHLHDKIYKDQRGLVAKAFGYTTRHEVALMRFLDDGRLRIDNNHSERAIRPIPVGRHAWFFVGSDDHAQSTANILSLVASARLHQLDSEEYLRDILRVLPHWPSDRYLELAPKYWPATHATLDPTQLAQEIGPLTIPPMK
jgi:transposase